MKLKFDWKSSHPRLQLRLLLAGGANVKVIMNGAEAPPPSWVSKGDILRVADRCVAFGATQEWFVRVEFFDVSQSKVKGLDIVAIYDDTTSPLETENIADGEDLEPNGPQPYSETLTIPPKAP